jgi:hypothetical protein
MSHTALLKFTQGPNTDIAGRAVLGTLTDGAVTITNGDNTDIVSWEIEVLDVPPGSAVPVGELATGVSATPTASFSPDVRGGCWRIRLVVHGTEGGTDEDIRCFGVLDHRGHLSPPLQSDPDPLDESLKPNELNFAGQVRGWAGDNNIFLWRFFRTYEDQSVKLVTTTPFTPVSATEADVYQVQTTTIGSASVFNVPTFVRTGQTVTVQDGQNTAATNPVTINLPGGHTFVDGSSSVVISLNGGSVRLLKIGATSWVVEEGNIVGVSTSLTSFLRVGTAPGSGATAVASQGHFRVRKDFSMFARASGDAADKKVLGLDGSDNLTLGGGGASIRPGTIDVDAETQVVLKVAADGKVFVSASQVQVASVANGLEVQGATAAARSVRLGVAPGGGAGAYASKGDVRVVKAFEVYMRANGDAADKFVIGGDGSDSVAVGDTGTAGDRPANVIVGAAGGIILRIAQASPAQLHLGANFFSTSVQAIEWASSVVTPTLKQADDNTAGITADDLTIQAQNATGTGTTTGGNLILQSGDGNPNDGKISFKVAATERAFFDANQLELNTIALAFKSTVAAPTIGQATDATAGVTGDAFTLKAQDVSGGSSAVGGKLILQAGDATAGTGSGGHALLRAGLGSGAGVGGNVALHADPSGWQSMEGGLFLEEVANPPTTGPSSGVFAYVDGGDLKVVGSGGTVTTAASAGQAGLKKIDRKTIESIVTGGAGATSVLTLTPPDNSEWIIKVSVTARDTGNDRAWFYRVGSIKKQSGTVTLNDDSLVNRVENTVAALTIVASGGTVEIRGTPDAANNTTFVGYVDILERA